ncbi:hypothetical protein T439DRAFT_322537 [Meredithblackwellia eburnea MCA 4105]
MASITVDSQQGEHQQQQQPLQPIISQPGRERSPLRLGSLSFQQDLSQLAPSNIFASPTSPVGPPTPSGILLNKQKFDLPLDAPAQPPSLADPSPALSSYSPAPAQLGGASAPDHPSSQEGPNDAAAAVGLGLALAATLSPNTPAGTGATSGLQPQSASLIARVASPDGSASDASGTTSASEAWSSSTAPSSTFGSPAFQAASIKPYGTAVQQPGTAATSSAGGSRSQSPSDSIATLSLNPGSSPSPARHGTVAAIVAGEEGTPRLSRSPSPHCKFAPLPRIDAVERPASRRTSSAANTQRPRSDSQPVEPFALDMEDSLVSPAPIHPNASLGLLVNSNMTPGTTVVGATISRRSSASTSTGRSRSPSPSFRSQQRPPSAQSSSRSHSPPHLSRHASTDAMHLHHIDGQGRRSNSRERGAPIRRDSSNASGRASPGPPTGAAALALSPSSNASDGAASPSMSGSVASLDGSALPPVIGARKTSFVEPAFISGRCRPSTIRKRSKSREGGSGDVFEVDPDADLEQVVVDEEEEDEEEEDDEEDEDEDENESEGGGEYSDEEDRGRDKLSGDEDEEDEEDPNFDDSRKTSKGAAVEVVHWHKDEPTEELST